MALSCFDSITHMEHPKGNWQWIKYISTSVSVSVNISIIIIRYKNKYKSKYLNEKYLLVFGLFCTVHCSLLTVMLLHAPYSMLNERAAKSIFLVSLFVIIHIHFLFGCFPFISFPVEMLFIIVIIWLCPDMFGCSDSVFWESLPVQHWTLHWVTSIHI